MKGDTKFGGKWSDTKLAALDGYLSAYGHVMKNQPFKTAYIDAFAGSGAQEGEDEEGKSYRHGSPLIALSAEPGFDHFIFIEKDQVKLDRLRNQVEEKGYGSKQIEYQCGDANEKLRALCNKDWKSHRAVAFLDPFALQIEWTTIQAIAKTQSIDMWLLFPSMAVNRMLIRKGEMEESWQRRLDQLFGANTWKDVFYDKEPDFFEDEINVKRSKPFEILSDYVTSRLKTEFAAVHDQPLILRNSANAPLFLLCFACGNKRGSAPALRIANHIIQQQS